VALRRESQLSRQHDDDMVTLETLHARTVHELRARPQAQREAHEQQLQDLEGRHAEAMSAVEVKHEAHWADVAHEKVGTLQEQHKETLDREWAAHNKELEETRAAHAKALQTLRAQHYASAEATTVKRARLVDELRSHRQVTRDLEHSVCEAHGKKVEGLASELEAHRREAWERENAMQAKHAQQLQDVRVV
jgi:hypothetical protein